MRNRTWSVLVLCAWWVLVVLIGAAFASGGTAAATTQTVPPEVDPPVTGQVGRLDERHGARVGS